MQRAIFASLLCIGLACGGDAKKADEPAKDDEKEAKADEGSDEKTTAKAEGKAEPLTEEEQKLIAADPATLSPDDRRKRSYALRKKIMQNPDSDAAKAIQEGKEAIERGEMQVPDHLIKGEGETKAPQGMTLSAPNAGGEPSPRK